jgi:hypothetical protein
METKIPLQWHEKLDALEIGGFEPVEGNPQSVYSAIRSHFTPDKTNKRFSIRNGNAYRLPDFNPLDKPEI